MGVRGLQTYLSRRDQLPGGIYTISILDEINNWKRSHSHGSPIIVFDLMGLLILTARDDLQQDIFCGGRHHQYFSMFDRFFTDLKVNGAELIFFCDLSVQNTKVDVWLSRRKGEYNEMMKVFDQINQGIPLQKIVDSRHPNDTLKTMTAMNSLTTVARKYGEFQFSTEHECDLELAQFARDKKALAVIANDTDFLIFEGNWFNWSAKDIDLNNLTTVEYSRDALYEQLALSHQQMALWATLMGNDYTGKFYDNLSAFHRSLGNFRYKFKNVANYVRRLEQLPRNLSPATIANISRKVFGDQDSVETRQAIVDGIKSYNLDFVKNELTDPLLRRLAQYSGGSSVYSTLVSTTKSLTLTFYDMRCVDITRTYTEVMAEVEGKIVGAVWQHKNDPSLTYSLLAKWSHQDIWRSTTNKPMYPPFTLPPLLKLIFDDVTDVTSPLNILRWKLLSWMLSIPEAKMLSIQRLPNEFLLIAVTLLFMVDKEQITADEADTILITEVKVMEHQTDQATRPYRLNSRFVRVAHIYTKIFSTLRSVFTVCGLKCFINPLLKFDGVLFHCLSEGFMTEQTSKLSYLSQIDAYRLYGPMDE